MLLMWTDVACRSGSPSPWRSRSEADDEGGWGEGSPASRRQSTTQQAVQGEAAGRKVPKVHQQNKAAAVDSQVSTSSHKQRLEKPRLARVASSRRSGRKSAIGAVQGGSDPLAAPLPLKAMLRGPILSDSSDDDSPSSRPGTGNIGGTVQRCPEMAHTRQQMQLLAEGTSCKDSDFNAGHDEDKLVIQNVTWNMACPGQQASGPTTKQSTVQQQSQLTRRTSRNSS
jgi:hypothetical protein